MGDVVAVTDVGEFETAHRSEMLLQSEDIGKRLAGMIQIAQCIDHRYAGPARQLFNSVVRKHPSHNAVGPTIQIPGNIFNRFPVADGASAHDRVAAELLDGQFKSES